MKAIETGYAGVLFRSRTEARWAVFFDSLSVEWRYEHEGFDLPSGRYLPDFWLPDVATWVEVKPAEPDSREGRKAAELAAHTGRRVVLVFPEVGYWLAPNRAGEAGHVLYGGAAEGWDCWYEPCICPKCGRFGFEYEGRGGRVCGVGTRCRRENPDLDRDVWNTGDDPRIVRAVAAARSYRFWNPAVAR